MVDLVEDVPRLEISQLRAMNNWPAMQDAGGARVTIGLEGGKARVHEVPLIREPPGALKRRWWLQCPSCGARRRHLYLHQDELACRTCHALLFYQQALPARFREHVGLPVLRAWRSLKRDKILPAVSATA